MRLLGRFALRLKVIKDFKVRRIVCGRWLWVEERYFDVVEFYTLFEHLYDTKCLDVRVYLLLQRRF